MLSQSYISGVYMVPNNLLKKIIIFGMVYKSFLFIGHLVLKKGSLCM